MKFLHLPGVSLQWRTDSCTVGPCNYFSFFLFFFVPALLLHFVLVRMTYYSIYLWVLGNTKFWDLNLATFSLAMPKYFNKYCTVIQRWRELYGYIHVVKPGNVRDQRHSAFRSDSPAVILLIPMAKVSPVIYAVWNPRLPCFRIFHGICNSFFHTMTDILSPSDALISFNFYPMNYFPLGKQSISGLRTEL